MIKVEVNSLPGLADLPVFLAELCSEVFEETGGQDVSLDRRVF